MSNIEEPVLILAPTGRDAVLISEALSRVRLPGETCPDIERFAFRLKANAAAGLLAEEALRDGATSLIVAALREQPAWSDVPLILMTNRRAPGAAVTEMLQKGGNVTLLERPIRIQTLTSVVGAALRQRRRQHELQDRLAEQQRTEERMRQAQKLESLGVLAGGIAHDFNNLLTGIIGNLSLALESEGPTSPRKRYLEDAIHASQRAADLTRQLLAYSGKGRFAIQNVDLSEAVREISSLVKSSISKNVHLILNLADGLPHIEADAAQLQQIVMNLIINAAEAIGPDADGLVMVETGQAQVNEAFLRNAMAADGASPGNYVYLEVRDTGCGIDEATLAKIFDPFFTTKFMGRGLGLAAVLGIVRGHRGALRVESTPGKGSAFQVLFPAGGSKDLRKTAGAQRRELSGRGTVLVADDEEIVRRIAKSALETRGYSVLLAENGQAAVDVFAKAADKIALVLLDLTMPVMNGAQTLQRLQRIRPEVKVILTSGYDETEAMAAVDGAGLSGFLQKPYTAGQLSEYVGRILDKAQAAGGDSGSSRS